MPTKSPNDTLAERPTEALRRWFSLKPILLTLLTFAVYVWLFGWKITLLLMLGLLWHEIGHAYAMSRFGLGVAGFYFVPLVGLVVSPLRSWTTRRQEAVIALAGPAWGAVSVLLLLVPYQLTGDPAWIGAAGLLAMINGFNLLPINPLDGGRVVKSITWSIHPLLGIALLSVGIAASTVLTFVWSPIFLLVAVISFLELRQDYRVWQLVKRERALIEDLGRIFYGRTVSREQILSALRQVQATTDDPQQLAKVQATAELLTQPTSPLVPLRRAECLWFTVVYLILATLLIAAATHFTATLGLRQLLQLWS